MVRAPAASSSPRATARRRASRARAPGDSPSAVRLRSPNRSSNSSRERAMPPAPASIRRCTAASRESSGSDAPPNSAPTRITRFELSACGSISERTRAVTSSTAPFVVATTRTGPSLASSSVAWATSCVFPVPGGPHTSWTSLPRIRARASAWGSFNGSGDGRSVEASPSVGGRRPNSPRIVSGKKWSGSSAIASRRCESSLSSHVGSNSSSLGPSRSPSHSGTMMRSSAGVGS